jgi:hypothetical protein
MRVAIIVVVLVSAQAAFANTFVEVHGVELAIPAGWVKKESRTATLLAPPKRTGRALEIMRVKAMPAPTPEAVQAGLQSLFGKDTLAVVKVTAVDRDGTKLVTAAAKLAAKKGAVDLDLIVVPVADHAVLVMSFVGADQDPVVRAANTALLASVRVAGKRITVTVTPPKQAGAIAAPQAVVDRITKIATTIDDKFRLPRPLAIKIEDCGEANAYYQPADHAIRVCHELFAFLTKLFTTAGVDAAKIADLTNNTVLFAYLHEWGHAFVGELGLPITGRGEDAADELATLVLANAKDKEAGTTIAMAAGQWFSIMQARRTSMNFADSHSLDGQRAVTIACLFFGSDPKRFRPLLAITKIDRDRAAKCIRDYPQRKTTWNQLLAPYHRTGRR